MKNLPRFRPFFFFLFAFLLNGNMLAPYAIAHGVEFSKAAVSEASFMPPPVCNTPTWPTTSNITMNAATFSWDAVYGAQNYSVQTRVPNGTWYTVPGSPFVNTSATVTWFLPNTTYQWRVRANCGGGESSYWTSPITFTTLAWDNCDAPAWLYTTNITQTTATLDWDPVNGAINYNIQWRLVGGSWNNLPGGPWYQTWHTLTNLQPATTYEWRVQSNCANWMQSPWSYIVSFTTLGSSCSTPTWPTTSNITQTSAKFNWDAVGGAESYSVQKRLPNGTWYTVPGSPVSNTWITVYGLTPGTTYEWRVRANCWGGQYSNWTYPTTFTTLGGSSCNAPYWLYTTNITQTTATFDWEPVSGAVSYSLQWRLASGTWYDVSGGPWTETWHTVTGLQPGTAYEWRVRSNCYNWNYSPWSYSEGFTTLGSSCNMPTWPTTSNITQTSAKFNWDAVGGAESYSVQKRLPNGTWYSVPGSPVSNTWITVYGLTPGTTYEWRVRANCWGGQYSNWTYPTTFTTLGGSSCNAPYWLYTTNITQTTATFDWEPVSGANSYSLQWRLAGGTWYDVSGGPWTQTWHTITGLQPGTAYEWRVRSNCYNWDYSPWSYSASFTTLGSSCSTPTWPTTSNITQTSAKFNWDDVYGAESYSVQTRLPNGTWYSVPGSPFSNTWVTVYGLSPATTYEWRVRANCWGGQYSNWTYPTTFTTLGGSSCNAPYWLYTSNITQTTATFDWSPVSGAISYSIQWRLTGGTWYDIPGGPWTETWYTITGLQPGTTYEWRVRSNCYNWDYSPWSYSSGFTTLGYSCGMPTWPYTSNITQTSASFSWDAVPGAESYSVQTRLPNGTWYTVPGSPVSNTWITVYGLTPGTTYEWRVRANCWGGQYSNWTYPTTFTTLGGSYCNAPYWLYTSSITQTTATFDWSPVSGAMSYSIQWRLAGGTWYDLSGGPWTETWHTITGLQPGTAYEWRVRSNCYSWNYSPWSYSASFTTLGYSCSTPTWTYTTNITESSATFHWSEVWGSLSYTVQKRLPNGTWYDVPESPTVNTWLTVYGLSPNTTYQWRVRANCDGGQYSYWTAPITFTTTGYSCYVSSWLYTSDITQTTAELVWAPVNGSESYSIQWRLVGGGTWYDLSGGPWTGTWHTITGLEPGTAYEWRVRSNCSNGSYSPWSNSASFTTLGASCGIPTGTTTTNITDTTATFNWSAVSGAQSYAVQTRLPSGTWYNAPGSPFAGTSVTVDGFIPGTTYEWRVRTNCSGGDYSYWTSPMSFTTSGTTNSGSDECDAATLLSVNSSCINSASSNVNTTESSPPPMGWCPTNSYKDVWFKFTMPDVNNPTVTIRTTAGSLTDGIMEVYRGADCSNLIYIYCEDDNFNGNGSTMPVISITGNPNETIWVRVWGYAGTTGTFSICVFNYQSNDYAVPDSEWVETGGGESLESSEISLLTLKYGIESPVLRVSPNPTRDVLQVQVTQTKESSVTRIVLLDMSGKIVSHKEYQSSDILEFQDQLDMSSLAPGIYVLRVVTTVGILVEKISVIE